MHPLGCDDQAFSRSVILVAPQVGADNGAHTLLIRAERLFMKVFVNNDPNQEKNALGGHRWSPYGIRNWGGGGVQRLSYTEEKPLYQTKS